MPQVKLLHVRLWHALSCPGQLEATMHSPQRPAPLHIWPMPQAVPAGNAGFDGAPLVHRSVVQGLVSSGRSLSSVTGTMLP